MRSSAPREALCHNARARSQEGAMGLGEMISTSAGAGLILMILAFAVFMDGMNGTDGTDWTNGVLGW